MARSRDAGPRRAHVGATPGFSRAAGEPGQAGFRGQRGPKSRRCRGFRSVSNLSGAVSNQTLRQNLVRTAAVGRAEAQTGRLLGTRRRTDRGKNSSLGYRKLHKPCSLPQSLIPNPSRTRTRPIGRLFPFAFLCRIRAVFPRNTWWFGRVAFSGPRSDECVTARGTPHEPGRGWEKPPGRKERP